MRIASEKCAFLLVYLSLLLSGSALRAQAVNRDYFLSSNVHYGFVIAHHGSMQYLVQGHTPGFEFTYTRPTHGEKEWQRAWHYPEYGLSFFYIYLSNPQELGSGFTVHPFLDLWLRRGERFNLKVKLTLAPAPGYLTRKFDRLENHKNNAIGSHFNGYDNIRVAATFRLSNTLRLETGIGMSHFSNGAISMPNLGINIPTLNLGLSYHMNAEHVELNTDPVLMGPVYSQLVVYGMAGLTQIDPPGQKKRYGAYTASIALERRISQRSKWTCGMEVAYNSSYIAEYNADTVFYRTKAEDLQLGLRGGYAICVGDLSFPIEMGVYLYNNQPSNGPVFHRIGMRYRLNKHWIANITLKTHWAKADFFEWGVGYSIFNWQKPRTIVEYK
jgi:hypothetical protein